MKYHIMSISDFARYKKTSLQTVYNNLDNLTTDNSFGTLKIVMDYKAEEWQPREQYRPKNLKPDNS